jgi:hypothetical protein
MNSPTSRIYVKPSCRYFYFRVIYNTTVSGVICRCLPVDEHCLSLQEEESRHARGIDRTPIGPYNPFGVVQVNEEFVAVNHPQVSFAAWMRQLNRSLISKSHPCPTTRTNTTTR